MRDARECIEADIVGAGVPEQQPSCAPALVGDISELPLESRHGLQCGVQQFPDFGMAHLIGAIAALFDLAQTMMHGRNELAPPLGIVEQIVLQVRVAVDHPHIAQHLVQHARRSAGAPLAAKPIQNRPRAFP